MMFASPIYLFALLPWAFLAYWLLQGRRRHVGVNYLKFWDGPVPKRARRSRPRLPPVALAAALLAMLLGIVAAAGPGVVDPGYVPQPVVIVVDQGITMSGRGRRTCGFGRWPGRTRRRWRRCSGHTGRPWSVPHLMAAWGPRRRWESCAGVEGLAGDGGGESGGAAGAGCGEIATDPWAGGVDQRSAVGGGG